MNNELIIDDEHLKSAGKYCRCKGNMVIDKMIDEYIAKLKEIEEQALISGTISDQFTAYIMKAESLKECAGEIGEKVENLINLYIQEIDNADQYLF